MEPSSFRKDLKKFDKELKLIFSGKKGRWEIWHKDRKGVEYMVVSVPMGELGLNVIERLWAQTPKKQGGSERVNALLDKMRLEEEEREKSDIASRIESVEDEAYNSLKRRTGQRVQMPGFTVNDNRRFKTEVG